MKRQSRNVLGGGKLVKENGAEEWVGRGKESGMGECREG